MIKISHAVRAAAAVAAFAVAAGPAQAQDQYLGQLLYVGFNFAPNGWAECNGQILPISSNTALFSLLGTFYGGNGTSTFALPNMQGRFPVSQGQGTGLSSYVMGQTGGSTTETVLQSNMPSHSHSLAGATATVSASSATANNATASGHALANTGANFSYATSAPNVSLSSTASISGTTGTAGSASPTAFATMPPYLTVNCVISLVGIFPPRS